MKTSLLKKLFIVAILGFSGVDAAQAQFATSGVGRYKEQIFWLNWDKSKSDIGLTTWPAAYGNPSGRLDKVPLVAGAYTWTITPGKVRVLGTISNLSTNPVSSANINVSPANGGTGGYSAGFLNMYGGVAGSIGIQNQINGSLISLTLQLQLQIFNGADWINITSPGIVVADTESLTVSNNESIQGTVNSTSNAWELIDYNGGTLTSATSSYGIQISNTGDSRVFRATNSASSSTNGDRQESTVMLARGATSLNLAMKGNGLQISAFGFMMPFDYGDLPNTYGGSAHYIPLLDNNGVTNVLANGTYNPKTAAIPSYSSRATIKLGANIDADNTPNYSINADGDDIKGIDDEDGISNATLNNITIKTTDIQVIGNNNGTEIANIHAWMDTNQGGVFNASNKLTMAENTVPNGSVNLSRSITLPANLKAGQYYSLRVRIATGLTHANPDLAAPNGEVEDYRIYIKGYTINGNVVNDANGIVDGAAGPALGTPGGEPLFAYLLDNNGTIVTKVPVDATTGLYTFPDVNFGDYTVKVSNNNTLLKGATPLATAFTLPEGWNNSAQKDANNTVGTAGYSVVSIAAADDINTAKTVTQGLNIKPVAVSSSYTMATQPTSGATIPLNNTVGTVDGGNLNILNYNDPNGGGSPLAVTITSLPVTNGNGSAGNVPDLLYNGSPVTVGTPIANFDPTKLSLKVNGVGYSTLNFKFTVTDAAGITSNEVTYGVQWSSPLPVSLISFKGNSAENQVILNWSTASEINSAYFEVQRRTQSGWVSFGKIIAGNNSDDVRDYNHADSNPSGGENLYRLKMVDLDGSVAYSRIIVVHVEITSRLYPNPAQEFIQIEVQNWNEVAKINILDNMGNSRYVSAGKPESRIDVRNLTAGSYIIKVENTDGTVITSKFVINR